LQSIKKGKDETEFPIISDEKVFAVYKKGHGLGGDRFVERSPLYSAVGMEETKKVKKKGK
jgi:hypothetical protein